MIQFTPLMSPLTNLITPREVMALYTCSRPTAYRVIRRLRLARVARGKYLVTSAALSAISLRAQITGNAALLPIVSAYSAPEAGDVSPASATRQPGRGVSVSAVNPGPTTSRHKKTRGKVVVGDMGNEETLTPGELARRMNEEAGL